MIPKKIHYCWFGGNPMPDKIRRCVNSWRELMPDYEYVLWDESNFDVHSTTFTSEAFSRRKWAFVSDYVRLYALYHCGGIYLDTDVIAYKRFDPFLSNHTFSSVESYFYKKGWVDDFRIEACVIGAEQGNAFIKCCLDSYDDGHFIDKDGSNNEKVINLRMAELVESHFGLVRGQFSKSPINLGGGEIFTLYPPNVFTHLRGQFDSNSVTLHLYSGSWRDEQIVKSKLIYAIDEAIIKVVGYKRYSLLRAAIRKAYLKLKDGQQSAL